MTPGAGAVFVNNIAHANGGSGFRIYGGNNGRVINNTSLSNGLDTEQFLPGEMHLGDFEGDPRPRGEGYDIGADELVQPGSCFVGASLVD